LWCCTPTYWTTLFITLWSRWSRDLFIATTLWFGKDNLTLQSLWSLLGLWFLIGIEPDEGQAKHKLWLQPVVKECRSLPNELNPCVTVTEQNFLQI